MVNGGALRERCLRARQTDRSDVFPAFRSEARLSPPTWLAVGVSHDPPPPRRREETLQFSNGLKWSNPSPNATLVPRSRAVIVSWCAHGGGGRFHGEGTRVVLVLTAIIISMELRGGGGPVQVAGTFGRVFNPQIYTHFYLSRYRKLIFHDVLGWNRCCRSVHKTALWCFTRCVWKHRK